MVELLTKLLCRRARHVHEQLCIPFLSQHLAAPNFRPVFVLHVYVGLVLVDLYWLPVFAVGRQSGPCWIVLRWPSVVDRTLKSNYWLTSYSLATGTSDWWGVGRHELQNCHFGVSFKLVGHQQKLSQSCASKPSKDLSWQRCDSIVLVFGYSWSVQLPPTS